MSGLDRFLDAFVNLEVLGRYWPDLLAGLWLTFVLSVAVIVTGVAVGLLLAMARAWQLRAVRLLIVIYADFFRALPPLVLILLIYFGFPNIGVTISGPLVVYLVLSLVLAAFAEEIFWAGITSVEGGQWEAGRSTGLGFGQTLLWIVMPQAVRVTIPPLANRSIAITKMTALGTVIGVSELLNAAATAQSFSSNASPLTLAALLYIALFLPFVIFTRWLERRFHWTRV